MANYNSSKTGAQIDNSVTLLGNGASLTSNGVLTGNGSSAITAEANLTFNGSTLAVTGNIDLSGQTVDVTLNNAADALNFDSNTLSIDALNNRVGIGTASPGSELAIKSDGTASDILTIQRSGGTDDVITLRETGTGAGLVRVSQADGTASVWLNGQANADSYFNSGGNVGIGTASPTSPGSTDTFLHISGTNHAGLVLEDRGHATEWEIQADDGLTFMESNVPNVHMYIDTSGNVGIGTTSPDGTFHIHTASAGTVTAAGDYEDLVVEGSGNTGISILTPDASTGSIAWGSPSNSNNCTLDFNRNNAYMSINPDKGLLIRNGTGPTSGVANASFIYAKDVSSSSEMFVRDEAGNATQISPHNFEMFIPDASYSMPWSYYSKNEYIGKEIAVDMYRLALEVQKMTGKQLIYEKDLPEDEVKDWYANQDKQVQESEVKIAEYNALSDEQREKRAVPESYIAKEPEDWLKSRLKIKKGRKNA